MSENNNKTKEIRTYKFTPLKDLEKIRKEHVAANLFDIATKINNFILDCVKKNIYPINIIFVNDINYLPYALQSALKEDTKGFYQLPFFSLNEMALIVGDLKTTYEDKVKIETFNTGDAWQLSISRLV